MSLETYTVTVPDRVAPFTFTGLSPEEIGEILINEHMITEANVLTVSENTIVCARVIGGAKA